MIIDMSEVKKQINCYQDDDGVMGTRTITTKYDWSKVPDWVQWIGTDADGSVAGFCEKPVASQPTHHWLVDWVSEWDELNCKPFAGDWRDSLEQRPTWSDFFNSEPATLNYREHPCATCPNFTNGVCCHSTTQNDFEAMDAKHCSPLCKRSDV